MADDQVGNELFRPMTEWQMAVMHGALLCNVAIMRAWLGGAAPADEAGEEGPSEAAKNPQYMTP